jgi:hypothetical protein
MPNRGLLAATTIRGYFSRWVSGATPPRIASVCRPTAPNTHFDDFRFGVGDADRQALFGALDRALEVSLGGEAVAKYRKALVLRPDFARGARCRLGRARRWPSDQKSEAASETRLPPPGLAIHDWTKASRPNSGVNMPAY